MLVSAIHQHGLAIAIGSFPSLPPISTASHVSRLSQSPSLSSLSHTTNSHWQSILHKLVYMFSCYCLHATLSILPPSPSWSPPLSVSISLLSMSAFVLLPKFKDHLQLLPLFLPTQSSTLACTASKMHPEPGPFPTLRVVPVLIKTPSHLPWTSMWPSS